MFERFSGTFYYRAVWQNITAKVSTQYQLVDLSKAFRLGSMRRRNFTKHFIRHIASRDKLFDCSPRL